MNDMKIKIGDVVMNRGCFGMNPPMEATVTGIELTPFIRYKYGEPVTEIPIEKKDYCVFSLAGGHWAYGEQITPIDPLRQEFDNLKKELFSSSSFIEVDDTCPKQNRYNQLLQYFYPEFRSKDWINPAISTQSLQICDSQEVEEAFEAYYL
jgi:hypothetical protein